MKDIPFKFDEIGIWSELKLEIVEQYGAAYTKAFARTPNLKKYYIDGFSGADGLLEKARAFIVSPNIDVRRDALEKLWDAFERLKTLEPGADKRAQAVALHTRAAASVGPHFRDVISEEALRLTKIGNELRICHSEIDKEIVKNAAQVDYLFARMFGFIRYLLISTGRGG